MKNILRAAMAAIIGLSMVACGEHALDTLSGSNYHVTVNDGSGTGDYPAGSTVSITAIVPSGLQFAYWTVNTSNTTLADANSPTTTFTMPASAVTVTANFTNGNGGVVTNPSSSSGGGGGYTNPSSSSVGDKIGYVGYTTDTLGTGSFESRKYKAELWNLGNKANFDILGDGGIGAIRADIMSKGGSKIDSLINQTFSDVISKWNNLGVLGNSKTAEGVSFLTDRLQTKNGSAGLWLTNGTTSRYFRATKTSEGIYTVVVHNISYSTYTYLDNTYAGKTGWGTTKAYLTSNGYALLNTYTNKTFSEVKTIYSNAASNIGFSASDITEGNNILTNYLQTKNYKRGGVLFYKESQGYRYLMVEQE